MKAKKAPAPWLYVMKDIDYALNQSGSLPFLIALLISAYLFGSPEYVRVFFAIVLLFCLTPQLLCSLRCPKGHCSP